MYSDNWKRQWLSEVYSDSRDKERKLVPCHPESHLFFKGMKD